MNDLNKALTTKKEKNLYMASRSQLDLHLGWCLATFALVCVLQPGSSGLLHSPLLRTLFPHFTRKFLPIPYQFLKETTPHPQARSRAPDKPMHSSPFTLPL